MLNTIQFSLAGFTLLGLLSCGGGSKSDPKREPPKIATTLAYSNEPTDTGRYRLVKGVNSTANTLILELRGPASGMGRGVTFGLQTDASAKFVKLSESDNEYARNGGVFELGGVPQLFKTVLDGNILRVSLAQKGMGNPKSLNGVLARVALQLQPEITQGTPVMLNTLNDARVLPENGNSNTINIDIGRVTAQ